MKPREGSFASNVLKWGGGGMNIDACRIPTNGNTAGPRIPNGREDRRASTGQEVVALDKGRWPANIILSEEAAALLDRQSPVSTSRRSVRRQVGSNVGNGKTMNAFTSRRLCVEGYEDEGGPSRFFYCAKASRMERRGNTHPTVKPVRLCQYLATLILPPAGFRKLLVPYCGSGSEMIGALLAGWDYVIGIEKDAEYVKVARRRLASLDAA